MMEFEEFIKELREQGLTIKKQKGKEIYELHDIAGLDAILFGNRNFFGDYRLSFWQEGKDIQFELKNKEDVISIIKTLFNGEMGR